MAEVTPGHWAAVVAYPNGPRILHTPNLPSSTNPDLAQRSLNAFASHRDLQPILHRYGPSAQLDSSTVRQSDGPTVPPSNVPPSNCLTVQPSNCLTVQPSNRPTV